MRTILQRAMRGNSTKNRSKSSSRRQKKQEGQVTFFHSNKNAKSKSKSKSKPKKEKEMETEMKKQGSSKSRRDSPPGSRSSKRRDRSPSRSLEIRSYESPSQSQSESFSFESRDVGDSRSFESRSDGSWSSSYVERKHKRNPADRSSRRRASKPSRSSTSRSRQAPPSPSTSRSSFFAAYYNKNNKAARVQDDDAGDDLEDSESTRSTDASYLSGTLSHSSCSVSVSTATSSRFSNTSDQLYNSAPHLSMATDDNSESKLQDIGQVVRASDLSDYSDHFTLDSRDQEEFEAYFQKKDEGRSFLANVYHVSDDDLTENHSDDLTENESIVQLLEGVVEDVSIGMEEESLEPEGPESTGCLLRACFCVDDESLLQGSYGGLRDGEILIASSTLSSGVSEASESCCVDDIDDVDDETANYDNDQAVDPVLALHATLSGGDTGVVWELKEEDDAVPLNTKTPITEDGLVSVASTTLETDSATAVVLQVETAKYSIFSCLFCCPNTTKAAAEDELNIDRELENGGDNDNDNAIDNDSDRDNDDGSESLFLEPRMNSEDFLLHQSRSLIEERGYDRYASVTASNDNDDNNDQRSVETGAHNEEPGTSSFATPEQQDNSLHKRAAEPSSKQHPWNNKNHKRGAFVLRNDTTTTLDVSAVATQVQGEDGDTAVVVFLKSSKSDDGSGSVSEEEACLIPVHSQEDDSDSKNEANMLGIPKLGLDNNVDKYLDYLNPFRNATAANAVEADTPSPMEVPSKIPSTSSFLDKYTERSILRLIRGQQNSGYGSDDDTNEANIELTLAKSSSIDSPDFRSKATNGDGYYVQSTKDNGVQYLFCMRVEDVKKEDPRQLADGETSQDEDDAKSKPHQALEQVTVDDHQDLGEEFDHDDLGSELNVQGSEAEFEQDTEAEYEVSSERNTRSISEHHPFDERVMLEKRSLSKKRTEAATKQFPKSINDNAFSACIQKELSARRQETKTESKGLLDAFEVDRYLDYLDPYASSVPDHLHAHEGSNSTHLMSNKQADMLARGLTSTPPAIPSGTSGHSQNSNNSGQHVSRVTAKANALLSANRGRGAGRRSARQSIYESEKNRVPQDRSNSGRSTLRSGVSGNSNRSGNKPSTPSGHSDSYSEKKSESNTGKNSESKTGKNSETDSGKKSESTNSGKKSESTNGTAGINKYLEYLDETPQGNGATGKNVPTPDTPKQQIGVNKLLRYHDEQPQNDNSPSIAKRITAIHHDNVERNATPKIVPSISADVIRNDVGQDDAPEDEINNSSLPKEISVRIENVIQQSLTEDAIASDEEESKEDAGEERDGFAALPGGLVAPVPSHVAQILPIIHDGSSTPLFETKNQSLVDQLTVVDDDSLISYNEIERLANHQMAVVQDIVEMVAVQGMAEKARLEQQHIKQSDSHSSADEFFDAMSKEECNSYEARSKGECDSHFSLD